MRIATRERERESFQVRKRCLYKGFVSTMIRENRSSAAGNRYRRICVSVCYIKNMEKEKKERKEK